MNMGWTADWSQAKNLLCVRLDSMGDVLMTEPAIRALKEDHPERRITLLTSPSGAEAGALLPSIDDVITYRAPWMKSATDGADNDLEFVRELRNRGFDGAVIFTVYSQNPLPAALMLYLAEIPLRLAHCRENPYHLLTHWVEEEEPEHLQRHEVQRQLDLVGRIGCSTENEAIQLKLSNAHRLEGRDAIRSAGIQTSRPWMVVHPGASASSRRYSSEGFAEVIRRLTFDEEIQVVLTGSSEESLILDEVQRASGLPTYAVVRDLSLGGLAALISEAPLLLSNNTGPVHLAAGVGTPVVDLYALTNPQHTPWHVASRVLYEDVDCKWCYSSQCREQHHACLDNLRPDDIVAAVLELKAAQEVAAELLGKFAMAG
jgi:lipopolysaccharide heptosyltransferase II